MAEAEDYDVMGDGNERHSRSSLIAKELAATEPGEMQCAYLRSRSVTKTAQPNPRTAAQAIHNAAGRRRRQRDSNLSAIRHSSPRCLSGSLPIGSRTLGIMSRAPVVQKEKMRRRGTVRCATEAHTV